MFFFEFLGPIVDGKYRSAAAPFVFIRIKSNLKEIDLWNYEMSYKHFEVHAFEDQLQLIFPEQILFWKELSFKSFCVCTFIDVMIVIFRPYL